MKGLGFDIEAVRNANLGVASPSVEFSAPRFHSYGGRDRASAALVCTLLTQILWDRSPSGSPWESFLVGAANRISGNQPPDSKRNINRLFEQPTARIVEEPEAIGTPKICNESRVRFPNQHFEAVPFLETNFPTVSIDLRRAALNLSGSADSIPAKFRERLLFLWRHGKQILGQCFDPLEYRVRVDQFWGHVGSLKEFLGTTGAITELVVVLRSIRFQFLGKQTPRDILRSLLDVFRDVANSPSIASGKVDHFLNRLDALGFDLNVPQASLDCTPVV
ncbi:MAG: hypothetical protein JNL10_09970 [Verrucomicrobiales bacterium]|nr:hypothetical protein [Verrucomicrobiales bacterium]